MSAITGTLQAAQASLAIQTDSQATGTVSIQTAGTFSGTFVFEATIDGVNWFSVSAIPVTGGLGVSSTTAAARYLVPVFGYAQVRARCSAYTSGACIVTLDIGTAAISGITPNGAGRVDSLVYFGTATAPAAAADILAAVTPGINGTFEVVVTIAVGAAGTEADTGNTELLKNASNFVKLANPAPGTATFGPIRMTLTSTDTIGVKAVGNATTAAVYATTVIMTQVA